MSDYIKINGTTYIPVARIKSVSPLTAEDQARISDRYEGVDGSKFNTQIVISVGERETRTKLSTETIGQLEEQGVGFVTTVKGTMIPAVNIVEVRDFRETDKARLEERGMTLTKKFRTSVDTTAGLMLSTVPGSQLLERAETAKSKAREAMARAQMRDSQNGADAAPTAPGADA